MQDSTIKVLAPSEFVRRKLNKLPNPPEQLFYMGTEPSKLLSRPCVAIVGSRKMTPYGRSVTELFARELARAGVVIISGNAFGVDVTAQNAALEAGGNVISVIPSDLKHIYPASNQPVAKRIVNSGGVLISEHNNNKSPRADEFLSRNRIIAAFSDLVIIPEAAERSGSLNTAKHALGMGIPIGVVPGPINNPLSLGTNKLMQAGAAILLKPSDVLQLLNIDSQNITQKSIFESKSPLEKTIFQAIAEGFNDLDSIQARCKVDTPTLQTELTMLEINGRLKQSESGRWQLVS